MKQIYLFLIFSIVFSSVSFAQVEKISKAGQISNIPFNKELIKKEKVNLEPFLQSSPKGAKNVTGALQDKKTFNFLKKSAALKAPAANLQVIYPVPPGAFLAGFFDEGGQLWNYIPLIIAPALRDVEFYPFSNDPSTKITWTMNNGTVDLSPYVDEKSVFIYNNLPSRVSYIPEIHGNSNGATATYSYGSIDVDGKPISGEKFLFSSNAEIFPLTNANVHEGGLYGSWSQTQYFGTGAQYNSKEQNGILNLFQKPLAPLYVKDMDVLIYNPAGGSIANSIPAGKSLGVYVYSLDAKGVPDGLIATTTITKDNVVPLSTRPNEGFIHISFDEIDDIGIVNPKTLLLKTAFIVEISGYDSSCSFRFPLSENLVGLGSAYAIYGDDEIIPFGDPNDPDYNGCDLFVQLNGAYNCLEFETGQDMLEVDTEGGNALFYNEKEDTYYYGGILYSSLPAEELSFTTPDWLTIKDINTSDYIQYGIIYVTVEGTALPSNLTGRADNIIVNSEGISKKIYVKQGNADWKFGTGIPTVKPAAATAKAVRQGDSFRLTYPQGTTSVAVYSVTGQKVAEYKLNPNGTASIPAANWSKGVYILKFAGKTNEAVKVIK